MGKRCWKFEFPKEQWSGGKKCIGFGNKEFYAEYERYLAEPSVKTRREIRREIFRGNKVKSPFYRLRKKGGRFK